MNITRVGGAIRVTSVEGNTVKFLRETATSLGLALDNDSVEMEPVDFDTSDRTAVERWAAGKLGLTDEELSWVSEFVGAFVGKDRAAVVVFRPQVVEAVKAGDELGARKAGRGKL